MGRSGRTWSEAGRPHRSRKARAIAATGYEAGVQDAGSGELLVEALDLRDALYGLDGKTKRAIALDELVMAVSVEALEHEEDCRCGLCRALSALGG